MKRETNAPKTKAAYTYTYNILSGRYIHELFVPGRYYLEFYEDTKESLFSEDGNLLEEILVNRAKNKDSFLLASHYGNFTEVELSEREISEIRDLVNSGNKEKLESILLKLSVMNLFKGDGFYGEGEDPANWWK